MRDPGGTSQTSDSHGRRHEGGLGRRAKNWGSWSDPEFFSTCARSPRHPRPSPGSRCARYPRRLILRLCPTRRGHGRDAGTGEKWERSGRDCHGPGPGGKRPGMSSARAPRCPGRRKARGSLQDRLGPCGAHGVWQSSPFPLRPCLPTVLASPLCPLLVRQRCPHRRLDRGRAQATHAVQSSACCLPAVARIFCCSIAGKAAKCLNTMLYVPSPAVWDFKSR